MGLGQSIKPLVAFIDAIEALGHHTVRNPADIGDTVLRVLKEI